MPGVARINVISNNALQPEDDDHQNNTDDKYRMKRMCADVGLPSGHFVIKVLEKH